MSFYTSVISKMHDAWHLQRTEINKAEENKCVRESGTKKGTKVRFK